MFKVTQEWTATNTVGLIAFLIGVLMSFLNVDGANSIALSGLGLVGIKKANDMIPKGESK